MPEQAVKSKPLSAKAPPTSVTIELPLPREALSPNARTSHWRVKAGAVAETRGETRVAAIAAMNEQGFAIKPKWAQAIIEATFHKAGKQARYSDNDNLISSLKAHCDGLQDAGLIHDDRGLTWKPPVQILNAKENKLVLVITKQG